MARTDNAIFTHPMPVDRGSEVTDEVASGRVPPSTTSPRTGCTCKGGHGADYGEFMSCGNRGIRNQEIRDQELGNICLLVPTTRFPDSLIPESFDWKLSVEEAQEAGRAHGFEELRCYQLALKLLEAGTSWRQFCPTMKDTTWPQIRRAALSTLLNIAEGYGRYHYLDKLRFFYIARGSLSGTRSAFIAAQR